MEINILGNKYFLDEEAVKLQQDFLDYKEYLYFKYGFHIHPNNYLEEDTFEKWKQRGKPKATLHL